MSMFQRTCRVFLVGFSCQKYDKEKNNFEHCRCVSATDSFGAKILSRFPNPKIAAVSASFAVDALCSTHCGVARSFNGG